ncbi:MAG: RsmB/NOP family class I SAM-dependent RNA methyltransferase [Sphingomonas sp.]|nr:RsmB/NOP family class I SAM-dependent RNA methyltransferase [Sphingomonas sp.]
MNPPKPSTEGVESRRFALQILDCVFRSGETVDSAAQGGGRLPPADFALTLAIVGETLRRVPELDALIDSATRQRIPDDSKARMVLRLALAQKLTMSVPDHAIVATALPLVDGGPRRLVHGVLGTLLRRDPKPSEAPELPADVEERWRKAWGDEMVEAARLQIATRPALDLSFASDSDARAYAEEHGGVSLAPGHVRLKDSGSIVELPGFGDGRWWVQDLAASLPARLIPKDAGTVLDACAAPGGKTMQLAAAGHRVLALDRSKNRLKRLAENLRRTGLEAEVAVADAREWEPPTLFDAVLIDAPCSATGTFRRNPEVLNRVRPRFVREAAEAQLELLVRSSGWVRPGGTLVYSVCSLEPQEGEAVISAFLDSNPSFGIGDLDGLPDSITPSAGGYVRTRPGLLEEEGGLDGFFVSRLVRSG